MIACPVWQVHASMATARRSLVLNPRFQMLDQLRAGVPGHLFHFCLSSPLKSSEKGSCWISLPIARCAAKMMMLTMPTTLSHKRRARPNNPAWTEAGLMRPPNRCRR